ncbi:hypothetical protein J4421_04215 [Candidatus Woesearchaeota archaeon]|nr:hypothetical protein [Candidatus Woesearchaeota archaeon]
MVDGKKFREFLASLENDQPVYFSGRGTRYNINSGEEKVELVGYYIRSSFDHSLVEVVLSMVNPPLTGSPQHTRKKILIDPNYLDDYGTLEKRSMVQ